MATRPVATRTEAKGTTAFQRTVELEGMSCILIVEAQRAIRFHPPRTETAS